jgi:hypothetical protein
VNTSHNTMPKAYTSLSFDACAKLITSGASQQAVPTPWVMLLAPVWGGEGGWVCEGTRLYECVGDMRLSVCVGVCASVWWRLGERV